MRQNCGMLSLSKGSVHMWISLYVQSSPAFRDVEIKKLYCFMWMTFDPWRRMLAIWCADTKLAEGAQAQLYVGEKVHWGHA